MTTKEKANQLLDKMAIQWIDATSRADLKPNFKTARNEYRKECALIAINEIKETLREVCDEEILGIHMIYWSKVQQELEKL